MASNELQGAALIQDILEDIEIQQAILMSLRDEDQPDTGNHHELIQQAGAKIRRLKKRLAEVQADIDQGHDSPASQTHDHDDMDRQPGGRSSGGGIAGHGIPAFGTPANGGSFGYVTTPSLSTSAQGSAPARKRTYSTHLDGGYSASSGNKSRKTTPSPALSTFSSSPISSVFGDDIDVVDLTGDNPEDLLREQHRMQQLWEQEKKDADYARLVHEGLEGDNTYGSPVTNAGAMSSGRTTLGRFMDRSSQISRLSGGRPPSHLTGSISYPDVTRQHDTVSERDGLGLARIKDEPASGQHRRGAYISPATPQPAPGLQEQAMPGSFPRFKENNEEDSDEEFRRMNGLPPRSSMPSVASNGRVNIAAHQRPILPVYQRRAGSAANNTPAAELARQAALSRNNSEYNLTGPLAGRTFGTDVFAHPPSAQMPSILPSRPGMLQRGSFNPFEAYGPSTARDANSGDNLSHIINRTSLFDWETRTDNDGNPFSHELVQYMDDVANDPRKNEEEIRELLSNIRPDMDIPAEEREGTPPELKYALYTHQQLALKWMKDMEVGTNKGGILADDMGLGKTISTLALIVSRQSADPRVKTNLIIGPVALIKQWESEIKKKLKPEYRLSVYLYHGKKSTYDNLRTFDVVLTTYGTLAQEYKRYEKYKDDHKGEKSHENAELTRQFPLVHEKSRFYRVILDEAQCIKNKDTQSAKGAHKVTASYRWCLTGTPMMNGVHELYSLIRFLRIKPYHESHKFNSAFGSLKPKSGAGEYNRDNAMRKLRVLLKAIMLRRMKDSKIDGQPILNLPPKTEEVQHVVFSDDEQDFYKTLEAKAQIQFNKYVRAGTVGKNYSNILVLLLRLRQACCHPHLNLDFESVGSGATAVDEKDLIALANSLAPNVVERLKAIEAFECPICMDAVLDPRFIVPCGHDACLDCITKLVENAAQNGLQAGQEGSVDGKCPQCRGPLKSKELVPYTVFKQVHMPEPEPEPEPEGEGQSQIDEAADYDTDSETESEASSTADENSDVDENGDLRDFIVPDGAEDDDDFDAACNKAAEKKLKLKRKQKKKQKKSKDIKDETRAFGKQKMPEVKPHMLKQLRKESSKNKEARRRYMRYLRDNWETSAKVSKACEILGNLKQTGEKTIVFSLWTGLLDLLEIPIKYDLGIKYTRYDGGMSRNERDEATRVFMEDPRVKVMLVSLKAGNAGLNLTAASQVIIMDPFWNPFIEMQAVDRAHRIGQQRPVQVHRILVQDTVEDRIVDLQQKKRDLVNAALDEGESKNLGRLSERELRFLFGVSH